MELESSQKLKLLETAVEDMREAVIITDDEKGKEGLRVVFVNEAAVHLTGYSREELLGQPIHIFHGPRTSSEEMMKWRDAMERGESVTLEAINYRKDESQYICNWSISPIRNAEGNITHWVTVQRDVTELRRSEEELVHSRKLRAVGELAGGIAHEFKNLLTPMLLQIQAVTDDLKDRPDLVNELTVVKGAIAKARDLSERVLVLGKKTGIVNEWCHLEELVDDNLKLLRKTIDRRIEVSTRIQHNLPFVWLSRSAFSQILLNLVLNARDTLIERLQEPHPSAYIPRIIIILERAEVTPPASLGMGNQPTPCQSVAVEDNGKGIPPELCDRLFDPFFTTKGPQRGTGLGLSLVWNLVNAMGGWVEVQSAANIGTRMQIFLPETAQKAPDDLPSVPKEKEEEVLSTHSSSHQSGRILLVEDEPIVAKAMVSPMSRCGYEVEVAADGKNGLEKVRQDPTRWDLIISDLNMPNMDGVDFVTHLRNDTGFKGKIAIITGYVAEEDMQRLQEINVDEVLSKPISREELLSCLQRLLNGN